MNEVKQANYLPWIAVAVLGCMLWSQQSVGPKPEPKPDVPVVVDARKLSHDVAVAMVRRMGDDMEKVAKSDAKTVMEAAAISVELDKATRDNFKKTMGDFMQQSQGNDQLPATSKQLFLDMAAGFRSVK